ncbi:hypothetical protein D1013_04250 [Euzebyella marina]|uniref:Uncharacterized protein n=1 Tax=Euzebyella marina TaxID=1761453 RepID=A0A3G2L306_9FLAO|nr:hypothetical protein [Euzebyella marina]AYN66650.1 hypothetical protein D1013_04250 [Euzebyella marina]
MPKNVNNFHKQLRSLLPDAFILTVVVATSPDTKPWKRKTTIKELTILIKYIDQLSFLFYDTHINSQNIFENNCVSQIKDIEELKNQNSSTQFLVSIGTFVNRPELREFRNLKIENIPNTLQTIKKSILIVNDSIKLVDGISIYYDWQTEKSEWKQFREHWAN